MNISSIKNLNDLNSCKEMSSLKMITSQLSNFLLETNIKTFLLYRVIYQSDCFNS